MVLAGAFGTLQGSCARCGIVRFPRTTQSPLPLMLRDYALLHFTKAMKLRASVGSIQCTLNYPTPRVAGVRTSGPNFRNVYT